MSGCHDLLLATTYSSHQISPQKLEKYNLTFGTKMIRVGLKKNGRGVDVVDHVRHFYNGI